MENHLESLLANQLLIECLVFVTVAGSLIIYVILTSSRDRVIAARMREIGGQTNVVLERLHHANPNSVLRWESLFMSNGKMKEVLQRRLLEAGIYAPRAMPIYLVTRVTLTIALPAVCFASAHFGILSMHYGALYAGPAAILGMFLPHVWLERRRARRHQRLRRSLPDFLDLIVACLGGGLSIQAALKQVTDELKIAHPELASELSITLREVELGVSLDHALHQLAIRTGLEELRTLRSFVHQTMKLGTTITDALEQMAEMLRIQRWQRAEEMAQKAVVKILFPTLLFIFPTVFVVLAGPAAIQIKEGLTSSTHHKSPAFHRE
jgi:tight adherence protein C